MQDDEGSGSGSGETVVTADLVSPVFFESPSEVMVQRGGGVGGRTARGGERC